MSCTLIWQLHGHEGYTRCDLLSEHQLLLSALFQYILLSAFGQFSPQPFLAFVAVIVLAAAAVHNIFEWPRMMRLWVGGCRLLLLWHRPRTVTRYRLNRNISYTARKGSLCSASPLSLSLSKLLSLWLPLSFSVLCFIFL